MGDYVVPMPNFSNFPQSTFRQERDSVFSFNKRKTETASPATTLTCIGQQVVPNLTDRIYSNIKATKVPKMHILHLNSYESEVNNSVISDIAKTSLPASKLTFNINRKSVTSNMHTATIGPSTTKK
jgi:hypothetical protein